MDGHVHAPVGQVRSLPGTSQFLARHGSYSNPCLPGGRLPDNCVLYVDADYSAHFKLDGLPGWLPVPSYVRFLSKQQGGCSLENNGYSKEGKGATSLL
jgi:hypothetical protein